jgi:hypothetical protein
LFIIGVMLTKVDYWGLNFSLDFRSKVLTSLFYESCDTEVIMNFSAPRTLCDGASCL